MVHLWMLPSVTSFQPFTRVGSPALPPWTLLLFFLLFILFFKFHLINLPRFLKVALSFFRHCTCLPEHKGFFPSAVRCKFFWHINVIRHCLPALSVCLKFSAFMDCDLNLLPCFLFYLDVFQQCYNTSRVAYTGHTIQFLCIVCRGKNTRECCS